MKWILILLDCFVLIRSNLFIHFFHTLGLLILAHLSETLIPKAQGYFSESETLVRATQASFCISEGLLLYSPLDMVWIEPLEFEIELPKPLDITAKEFGGF